jgi:hypothetical protein
MTSRRTLCSALQPCALHAVAQVRRAVHVRVARADGRSAQDTHSRNYDTVRVALRSLKGARIVGRGVDCSKALELQSTAQQLRIGVALRWNGDEWSCTCPVANDHCPLVVWHRRRGIRLLHERDAGAAAWCGASVRHDARTYRPRSCSHHPPHTACRQWSVTRTSDERNGLRCATTGRFQPIHRRTVDRTRTPLVAGGRSIATRISSPLARSLACAIPRLWD